MTLDLEQIKEIIPHRDPFLLIDEVTEMEPGVSVTAKKYLKPDEYWFKGHFPGQPVQPGVLMIEMLAQAGAVCAYDMTTEAAVAKLYYLFSCGYDAQTVKEKMEEDLAGEISK